jgi:hypothetical protein
MKVVPNSIQTRNTPVMDFTEDLFKGFTTVTCNSSGALVESTCCKIGVFGGVHKTLHSGGLIFVKL